MDKDEPSCRGETGEKTFFKAFLLQNTLHHPVEPEKYAQTGRTAFKASAFGSVSHVEYHHDEDTGAANKDD